MKKSLYLCILGLFSQSAIAQTTVFSEDFQGGIPATFTLIDNDGLTPAASVSEFTDAWIAKEDPDMAGDTVAASTSYFDPAGTADRWLITPAITLGGYGNFLYWEAKSHDASFPDGYQVLISTTDTQISSFDTLHTVLVEIDSWNSRSLSIGDSNEYINQTVYIAFVNRTNDGFKLYIDDISVQIEDPVGIEENILNNISVSPNPFTDQIAINNTNVINAKLLTLSGSILYEGSETVINTSNIPTGVYLLMINTDHGTVTKKITKL